MFRSISRLICFVCLAAIAVAAPAQVVTGAYRNRPFYTYDMYDALDGYDYGHGVYGGADYFDYEGDFVFDRDQYGDWYDFKDYGGYDYLGYDDDPNVDAGDGFVDEDWVLELGTEEGPYVDRDRYPRYPYARDYDPYRRDPYRYDPYREYPYRDRLERASPYPTAPFPAARYPTAPRPYWYDPYWD